MLDADVDDLNKTIKVQTARLKIFEAAQSNISNADMFKGPSRPQEACCASHNCVCHSSCSSCCRPTKSCCCSFQPCPGISPKASVNEDLTLMVSNLHKDVEIIKNILKVNNSDIQPEGQKCSKAPLPTTTPASSDQRSKPPSVLLPNQMIVESEVHETPRDISISSLEEFIPSPDSRLSLNCNLLTNQLS